jgi:hypothetical protein
MFYVYELKLHIFQSLSYKSTIYKDFEAFVENQNLFIYYIMFMF